MTEMNCQKCGYSWEYTGKQRDWASCPNCKTSVRIDSNEPRTIDEINEKLDRLIHAVEGKSTNRRRRRRDIDRGEVETADVDDDDIGGSTNRDSGGIYDPTEGL